MSLSRLTLRQLEAFIAVAEHCGFAAAASHLGLSASAVSQLVAELESTIGFRLFNRSTRHVELSSAGQDYLAAALTVLKHVRRADAAAADLRNRAAGVVRIAAPLVLASMFLPAAIRRFTEERPKVVLRILDTPVDALVDAVSQGDVDLAVGPDRRHGREISSMPVLESPWVLWCAPHHPAARYRTIRWTRVRDFPLVAAGRDHEHSVAQMHESLPDDKRVGPREIVDNITTAFGLSSEGLVATLAPDYVGVLATRFGLIKRRVIGPEVIRRVCIYRPVGRTISPAAEAFADFLFDWLPERVASDRDATDGRHAVLK